VPPVLLLDSDCVLCNGFARFVIERERTPELRFGSIRSTLGDALGVDDSSMVLVEAGVVWRESTAVLRTLRRLRKPWRWLAALLIAPRPIRDAVYRLVARHRYRLFGRRPASCPVPSVEDRVRVIADVTGLETTSARTDTGTQGQITDAPGHPSQRER